MRTEHFFAIGTSLATLTNVETVFGTPAHVLPGQAIRYLGSVRRQALDKSIVRNGSVNAPMQFDVVAQDLLLAAITTYWGGFTTGSRLLYASWWDETNHYSPFSVELERPIQGEHYQVNDQIWARELAIPGWNWQLQTVTKTANATITTGERLAYGDTTSGNITFTLPPAASPNPNTVFSFIKSAAANDLVIDGDGSETINGNATVTLSALNARLDIYSNGSNWFSV